MQLTVIFLDAICYRRRERERGEREIGREREIEINERIVKVKMGGQ
jgi:hypothetical protein